MTQPSLVLELDTGLAALLRPPQRLVTYPLTRRASIKDVIESLDIPHTEVGTILLDAVEVDFSQPAEPGRRYRLRDPGQPLDWQRPHPLRPHPLPRPAFLADANVGRLGRLLRLLGLDTVIATTERDGAIAARAHGEGRILLSRDRRLLRRRLVEHGQLLRQHDPYQQLVEVLHRYGLQEWLAPGSRCVWCNARLQPVAKATILHRLEPLTRRYYDTFRRCPACDRIYWQGSHWQHLQQRLAALGIAG